MDKESNECQSGGVYATLKFKPVKITSIESPQEGGRRYGTKVQMVNGRGSFSRVLTGIPSRTLATLAENSSGPHAGLWYSEANVKRAGQYYALVVEFSDNRRAIVIHGRVLEGKGDFSR